VVKLGIWSVANVLVYRLACLCGLYRLTLPVQRRQLGGPVFNLPQTIDPNIEPQDSKRVIEKADQLLRGELEYFSCFKKKIGSPPNWFHDPFTNRSIKYETHWSRLDEFASGDIKAVWEASRFEWAPLFAQAWRLTGHHAYLEALGNWLEDWNLHNPVNQGVNWKCGQEASIRVLNLLLAARLLKAHLHPANAFITLIQSHCQRILPTIRYAIAQNNNHGTSEAAALFVCGAWLLKHATFPKEKSKALHWKKVGRHWLEDRARKLIAADGSFSQYSVNYHRVLLDTLCQVELWRRDLGEEPFSDLYMKICALAVDWLASMTDEISGNAPNLGANDGARLYNLSTSPYRDFRPTIQLSSLLFKNHRVYDAGPWDEHLHWFGINPSDFPKANAASSVLHPNGGDVVLRSNGLKAVVRFANFRFRPSHADCLHLDLWSRGQNLLRDGGTYSYNTDDQTMDYFSGTASHNTVQFDGLNQMPRISRFLFGDWLKMTETGFHEIQGGRQSWVGAYRDSFGANHRRKVEIDGKICRITDEIDGYHKKAVLRWRLIPDEWMIEDFLCEGPLAKIKIKTNDAVTRCEMVSGWESLHYMQKTELPVFEIEFAPNKARVITDIIIKN
jgi:hypothetical protein